MKPLEGITRIVAMRSAHQRINTAVMIALVAFILVLANLIARQFYFRIDASATGRYSLSKHGEAAARAVKSETTLYFFGSENSPEFGRARDLLESSRYANRNISYEMHDLDRSPVLAGELGVTGYNTLVAVSDGRRFSMSGSSEDAVTMLLVRASRRKMPAVGFLAGHGERAMDGRERSGYGFAAERLRSVGYELKAVDLSASGNIPPDVDLVVMAGPVSALFDQELAAIERYAASGGRLLVMAEAPEPSRKVLSMFGVLISEQTVNDSVFAPGAGPSSPMITAYAENPVTAGIGSGAIFPSVHALAGEPGDERFRAVIATSGESWLDMDGNASREDGEKAASYAIAAAVVGDGGKPKAVLFGDADFASNAYIVNEANAGMFLNAVEWLSYGEASALASPSSQGRAFVPMFVTDDQARIVRTFGAIGIPAVIALAGFAVWFRRRGL
ncbi:MAG: GldG family protein [Nitrospirae bacterium]|nr:GldG family protein [Nitrospirota bacterium]